MPLRGPVVLYAAALALVPLKLVIRHPAHRRGRCRPFPSTRSPTKRRLRLAGWAHGAVDEPWREPPCCLHSRLGERRNEGWR
jgi:hypothetical protein